MGTPRGHWCGDTSIAGGAGTGEQALGNVALSAPEPSGDCGEWTWSSLGSLWGQGRAGTAAVPSTPTPGSGPPLRPGSRAGVAVAHGRYRFFWMGDSDQSESSAQIWFPHSWKTPL